MGDIGEILKQVPEYITLFYPGYITVYLYYFFTGKRLKDSQWLIAKAVCLSYIYIICIEQIVKKTFVINVCLVITGCIIGVLSAKIRCWEKFDKFLGRIQRYSNYSDNEFEVLRNDDRSVWVCVYLKDSDIVYEGSLREAEDAGTDVRYICISGYYKYALNKEYKPIEPYIEDCSDDNEKKVIIHYDDIKVVEKRC